MAYRRDRSARPRRRARMAPGKGTSAGARLLMHGLLLGVLALFLHMGLYEVSDQGAAAQEVAAAAPWSDPKPPSRPIAPIATPDRQVPRPTAAPVLPKPTVSPTPASLTEELKSYVAGLDGTYGVAVLDLKDGQTVSINADRVFPTASLYKVLVMYRVYQAMEQGTLSAADKITIEAGDMVEADEWDKLSPGQVITVSDAVERMITESSNIAAYALARQVGSWNGVLQSASQLGMKETTWNGEDFVTTPNDMLHFFELLANRSLLSPKASDEMTAVLLRQKINDRLPADLPAGTKVAHKTGELTDIRNDGGIVFANNGPYVIVLMGQGINPADAVKAEATISRMVFDWLVNSH